MAPEPFRTQLYRRQRVLDLVSKASSDISPRRDALCPDERRHVIEHHDGAVNAIGICRQGRGGYGQMDLSAIGPERDFLGGSIAAAWARVHQHACQRLQTGALEHAGRRLTENRSVENQQSSRCTIDRADPSLGVYRDHPSRDSFENRFDILAATVDLKTLAFEIPARPLKPVTARRQLARQGIERLDQRPELVLALRLDAMV